MNIGALGIASAASAGLATLGESLKDAVVEVRGDRGSSGAGIIWGGAGLVVTAAHCVPRGAVVRVETKGTWRNAELLAYHEHHDLALLTTAHARGAVLEIRETDSLRAGELVFAYGHPLGVRGALSMGVLHGVVRDHRSGAARWIVADVRLAPGNSGGPLVDGDGRLIGINAMVVNGLGAAVPATVVQRFVELALAQRAA